MVDLLIPAIVALPMIGFLITALIGRRLDKQAHIVPVGVVVLVWLFAMVVVVMALSHAAPFDDEAAGYGYTIRSTRGSRPATSRSTSRSTSTR